LPYSDTPTPSHGTDDVQRPIDITDRSEMTLRMIGNKSDKVQIGDDTEKDGRM